MIRLRLGAFVDDSGDLALEIGHNETLWSAIKRVTEKTKLSDEQIKKGFQVLLNGTKIPVEFWEITLLKQTDNVLVAPRLSGGDSEGDMFLRGVAVLALGGVIGQFIGAGLSSFFGVTSAAGGYLTAAFGNALGYIGAASLINSLFPLPNKTPQLSPERPYETSQMYAITSQSNQLRKFDTVPKVYGRHKFFPYIAANPYTDLEADPVTGELIQYFYCIYDFGLGPAVVSELKIGNTPIGEFSDLQYNFVDPNKPDVNEGPWDEALQKEFTLYKGDNSVEDVGYALNKNESQLPTPPLSEYQTVRNAATNTNGVSQEITLTFICPQGLIAYDSRGNATSRSIDLRIEFSKASEDVWRGWNDVDYVSNYTSAGGAEVIYEISAAPFIPPVPHHAGWYNKTTKTLGPYAQLGATDDIILTEYYIKFVIYKQTGYRRRFGYPAGTTTIVAANGIPVGATVGYSTSSGSSNIKQIWGKVVSVSAHSPGFSTYVIDRPLPTSIHILTADIKDPGGPVVLTPESFTWYRQVYGTGVARITRQSSSPVYATFKFTPREIGSYKVRVTRVSSSSSYTSTVYDALTWTSLSTRFNSNPIQTTKRHVFLEVKIRATNQLNGAIQSLSGVVSSVLDVWNGTSWVKQETSNPAWVFCDLLTGQVSKRPIPKSRLHLPTILEWRDFCDEIPTAPPSYGSFITSRFTCNFVLDFNCTLADCIQKVTSAAQATMNIIDGKYGILVDKLRTIPVQIFTPRNIKSFSSQRVYTRKPHAIKVRFIDPQVDWEVRDIIVYDTGYDADNATEIDEVTSFAVINPEQAWRWGRYVLAQNRLRQENISIVVDFEHLVCTRGDYVKVTQDAMKVGGTPARVKSRTGTQIVIDDAIETGPYTYGYIFRSKTGTIHSGGVTVVSADTFNLTGTPLPDPGDLIVIGVTTSLTLDCIVKSIIPNDDLSATLLLVERASAIYTAESTDDLPPYDPEISPTVNAEFAPPGEVPGLEVEDYGWECAPGGYRHFVKLRWGVPEGAAYENFEVYLDTGRGYSFVTFLRSTSYDYTVKAEDLGIEHKFKVLAVSATGRKLDLGSVGFVSVVPEAKTTPPSDVNEFASDITGEVLMLSWESVPDCDLNYYLIRYSPLLDATWETSAPLLTVSRNVSSVSFQARVGTYLIKAVDYALNESENAAAVITSIPKLFNLNVIEDVNDWPTIDGAFDRTEKDDVSVLLLPTVYGGPGERKYHPVGHYYYNELLDLGEIYTVRLQSLVQAQGFTIGDLMIYWDPLSEVDALAAAGSSSWDVETQVRKTDQLNVIANWTTLSAVISMSEGDPTIWSDWQSFTIGDFTGRIFQFRLKLLSFNDYVSPRIMDGLIRADMPDRVESYQNLVAPVSGYTVTYSPAFAGPSPSPSIQISLQNGQSGDYWEFTSRTLTAFTIKFYDKDGNAVSRTFDAQVKGYGRRHTEVI